MIESTEKRALTALRHMRARLDALERERNEPIAIVGMACRYPGGASTPSDYWQLLREGRDGITDVPSDRWDADAYYDSDSGTPCKMNTRWGGFLENIDRFDASFFRLSPREAGCMDPQQRLLLEVGWEALEDAGLPRDRVAGSQTGVYVGVSNFDYATLQAGDRSGVADPLEVVGTSHSAFSGRMSFFFDIHGPSVSVDTACSSSLVATHLAVQGLRTGECDMAISGGVNLLLSPYVSVALSQGGFMAADGRCKTFDERADGYVRSEGCGVVVLKRLRDAQESGDRIWAVIRGTAINQDGSSAGLTAPNPTAQTAVIRRALSNAGVPASSIGCVEAHGTGTSLGDPIEVEALAEAFGEGAPGSCALGSVKTNLGHLESAAGVAGLMKMALALHHKEIPPHLYLNQLNPRIRFEHTPFAIPRELTPWNAGEGPRRAGVSSFSFTGTNAHVVLEEAPRPQAAGPEPVDSRVVGNVTAWTLPVSAKSEASLVALAADYARVIGEGTVGLADFVHTASVRRSAHAHRICAVGRNREELVESLSDLGADQSSPGQSRRPVPSSGRRKLAFVFSGQGSQWPGMGVSLYEGEPVFREAFDACAKAYAELVPNASLLDELRADANTSRLDDTAVAQPLIFAVQHGLTALWRSWGVEPAAVVGHSVGEVAAACAAGVLSTEDGVRVVVERARSMEGMRGQGAMVSVGLDESALKLHLKDFNDRLSIAALNGPSSGVVSGDVDSVSDFVRHLEATGVSCRRVRVEYGFHSIQMQSASERTAAGLSGLSSGRGSLSVYSTVTGAVREGRAWDADYWARNVREPVRFRAAIESMAADGCTVFLEIGGHPVLHGALEETLDAIPSKSPAVLGFSLRRDRNEHTTLRESLGKLWCAGVEVEWCAVNGQRGECISLPPYAWERSAHWFEERRIPESRESKIDAYAIGWEPAPFAVPSVDLSPTAGTFLFLAPVDDGMASRLAQLLRERGAELVEVEPVIGTDTMEATLAQAMRAFSDQPCCGVIHAGDLFGDSASPHSDACLFALRFIQRQLRDVSGPQPRHWFVTCGAQVVSRAETPEVTQAPLWGLGRVIALEHPECWGGLIDLDPNSMPEMRADQLLAEITRESDEDQIAYRDETRFAARLMPSKVLTPATSTATFDWSVPGAILITGGLGALGLQVAQHLVERGARHLILLSRRRHPECNPILHELEAVGARVDLELADVADLQTMARCFAEWKQNGVHLRGVIHAAGVSHPASVVDTDAEVLRTAHRAKVAGAEVLDKLTLGLELECFVLFSSIASVWGSAGLCAYAAANACLDVLAHRRRSEGRPATSLNWGPWSGGGMTSEDAQRLLDRVGVTGLEPDACLRAMDVVLASAEPQVTLAKVDWSRFKAVYSARRKRPFLDAISDINNFTATIDNPEDPESPEADGASTVTWSDQWRKLPAHAREETLRSHVCDCVARALGLSSGDEVDPEVGFFDLGMDSVVSVELRRSLELSFGQSLPPTLAFDYPTAKALGDFLLDTMLDVDSPPASAPKLRSVADAIDTPLAIVGMACRMPGGIKDPAALWALLARGEEAIGEVPRERWDIEALYDSELGRSGKMYTRRGGFVRDVDRFDAGFFGIGAGEARSMDPQQRLLLEVGWEALEDAGLTAPALSGSHTGVFLGLSVNSYQERVLEQAGPEIEPYFLTGNMLNMAAGRLSHAWGLRGPSLVIDTACSSSLVALHLAGQSVRLGECEQAVVGGVNLMLSPGGTVAACQTQMLSPDGRCKTFDARADGYVRSEGCGVVVVKRLDAAVASGDRIWAVIRGSAVNHDGHSSGLTVPNGTAQQDVIREALANAGVDAGSIQCVEAHGTGTPLGDPIEINALGAVLGDEGDPVRVGSVKTNLGHLEAAAGMAGLMKLVVALQAETIPAHLHVQTPNPNLTLKGTRIALATEATPWPAGEAPRRAGLSSFGFSGTNAHVIVEEAPVATQDERNPVAAKLPWLLPLSAKCESSLRSRAASFADFATEQNVSLFDIVHTAAVRRTAHDFRVCIAGRNREDLVDNLAAFGADRSAATTNVARVPRAGRRKLAFVFSGQGNQNPGMGIDLYKTETVFRDAFDVCAKAYAELVNGPSLIDELNSDASRMADTEIAQPLIYAVQHGLTELWRSWGVEPAAVVGHSVGEVAAACAAGVLCPEDGMRVVVERARSMAGLRGRGGMVSVELDEATLTSRLEDVADRLSLAAINGPGSGVVSGDEDALSAFVAREEAAGVACRRVRVEYPFHSAMMHAASERVAEQLVDCVTASAGVVPAYSTVTATQLEGEAWDANHWGRNVRECVRFQDAIEAMIEDGCDAFLEIGGHPVLHSAIEEILDAIPSQPDAIVAHSLRRGRDPHKTLRESLGHLWSAGVEVDWRAVTEDRGTCIALPAYTWNHAARHWVGDSVFDVPGSGWLYRLDWPEAALSSARTSKAAIGTWLILDDESPLAADLRDRLVALGAHCVSVLAAETYQVAGPDHYRINVARPGDYDRMIEAIFHDGHDDCAGVVQFFAPGLIDATPRIDQALFGLHAIQAITRRGWRDSPRVFFVTRGARAVAANEAINPTSAGVCGLAKVVEHEYPELCLAHIDVEVSQLSAAGLLEEVLGCDGETEIAHRKNNRHVARLVPCPEVLTRAPASLSADYSYLITGGLGGLGLRVAEAFVIGGARHLVLASRSAVARETAVEQIDAFRKAGVTVRLAALDVADASAVDDLLSDLRASEHPLRGVVHAAGVLDDGIILHQDGARMRRVWLPKAEGAWNLHQLSQGDPLDFFVLFSSVASLLGSPGQANYAAANATLDALVAHRRANGLCAIGINWGPWAEVGMAADRVSPGMDALHPDAGIRLLTHLLGSACQQVCVAAVAGDQWSALAQLANNPPLLTALVDAPGTYVGANGGQLRADMEELASSEDRRELLDGELCSLLAEALGLAVGEIDWEWPLADLGMDSLMAVSLKRQLEQELDISLTSTLLITHPTLAELGDYLFERLEMLLEQTHKQTFGENSAGRTNPPPEGAGDLDELISEVEHLSDDAVEQLLREPLLRGGLR